MKKKSLLWILLAIAIVIGGWFVWKKNSVQKDIIKIGAVFPITGDVAEYGKYWKQGLELAIDDAINEKLIKKGEVELIVEDGKADPTLSVNAFNKLCNIDKVSVCFSATSGVTLALKPLANKNKVILMNASAISTSIEDSNDFLFSVIPNASLTGDFLAESAYKTLHKRKAGILYRNDASGKSFYDVFKNKFESLGGKIVYSEAHPINNTDFNTYILKLKNIKNIDVLFVASWGNEVAYFAKQAKENNFNVQILAYETFKNPEVIKIAGDAINGVVFSSPKLVELEDSNTFYKMEKEVHSKFNQNEVNYHILGHYDAMMIILKAISKGNRNAEQFRNYLNNMDTYKGLTGDIKFDANGAVILPLGLYTVKNKHFTKF